MPDGPICTRTRIAPTPSGFLHLGNIYSFALTVQLAHSAQARTLLRIDDLDRERIKEEYVQDIFDTLDFLGIPWDEGPRNLQEFEQEYSQQLRLDIYRDALRQLEDRGAVFACECSRTGIARNSPDGIYSGACRDKGIPLDTENICWRLRTEDPKILRVKTWEGKEITALLPDNMRDFIVRRKDGHPAYQLASLADDIHFGVDLIVRGQDLWDSTLAQLYLSQVLGNDFSGTVFHHHPLLSEGGKKMSKSAGASSVRFLRAQGVAPSGIFSLVRKMSGTL